MYVFIIAPLAGKLRTDVVNSPARGGALIVTTNIHFIKRKTKNEHKNEKKFRRTCGRTIEVEDYHKITIYNTIYYNIYNPKRK